jgi:transcriptional regulator with XRE-family HTH domain
MKEIGKIIQQRRKELGITQQELADLTDVGINTLVAIERGQGNPSIGTLEKIVSAIGYDLMLVRRSL